MPGPSAAIPTEAEPASSTVVPLGPALARRSLVRPLGWVASIAAAIVLSVVATSVVLGPRVDDDGAALAKVAGWTVDIAGTPDAHRVLLASAGGGMSKAHGELTYAPSSMDLVVVARGLARAPAGKEYRCWLEAADGTRTRIGRMASAYDVFFWVGDVPALANIAPGTKFGVSLANLDAGSPGAPIVDQPVLVGQL
jgi:hypothetical protein